jgi:hypothetical protein
MQAPCVADQPLKPDWRARPNAAATTKLKDCFLIAVLPLSRLARAALVHARNLTRWSDTRLLQVRERPDFWCAKNVTVKVQKYHFQPGVPAAT